MPYSISSSTAAATWAGTTLLSRIRKAESLALATDTQDPRWLTDPTWVAPALPELAYVGPEEPTLWAYPLPAPYHIIGRHRGGSTILFVDGHVCKSNSFPSEVSARISYVNTLHIP